jgi:hypothetical protein
MTENFSDIALSFLKNKSLKVKFSRLDLSGDSGLLLVREAEGKIKICHGIADCLGDNRQEGKIRHSKARLILQRVLQIVAGYEDVNDSNYLRHDPIFKILCTQPEEKQEDFQVLASQPTMSRWENQITNQENKKLRKYFVENFLTHYPEDSSQIVLDIDGWDAQTYGHQQLSLFHGYYGHKMYFPILINEASTGYPLVMQLRAGNSHSGKGIVGILRWLLWRIKKAMPHLEIVVRGDAGFSLPEIIKVCERSQVKYAFGFSNNAVLKRKIDNLLEIARVVYNLTGQKARLFDDVYYAANSWSEPRRIIMKAEWLEKGANPRFLVTNLEENAAEVYDKFYVQRGESSEGRIKELKRGIKADRLSCHEFIVNQFRLFLSQAAYILMLEIRQAAKGTKLEKAQVSRLRESVIKVAAKVTNSVGQVLVELAACCPYQREIAIISQRLYSHTSMIFN